MIHRMDPARGPRPRADAGADRADARPLRGPCRPTTRSGRFEIKWDGVRAIAYCEPGRVRLESRNLNDISDSYPELARLGRALGSHSAILDGEIVAFDEEGRPSFGALQQRMHVSSARRPAGSPSRRRSPT